MATNKIIVSGSVGEGVEQWLLDHGARLEYCLGLCLAELPERAQVYMPLGADRWHVTVSFYGSDGNWESTYLDIETAEDDAQETVWRLETE